MYSFVRSSEKERLVILSNFDAQKSYSFSLKIPPHIIEAWGLETGEYPLEEMLYGNVKAVLQVSEGFGAIAVDLPPLESFIFKAP